MSVGPLSDYRLERLALGELPPDEAARLLADPAVARRVEELKADNARFLSRHPLRVPAQERRPAPGLRVRLGAAASAAGSFLSGRAALPAFALAALLVVAGGYWAASAPGSAEDFRLKGDGAKLYLYQKTDAEAVELSDGSKVKAGAAIQVAYAAGGAAYGCIFSLDGSGSLTAHLPEKGKGAAELAKGKLRVLESSYVLDAAPRYELFLLVSSRRTFDAGLVKAAALTLKDAPDPAAALAERLGPSFAVASVKLIKE